MRCPKCGITTLTPMPRCYKAGCPGMPSTLPRRSSREPGRMQTHELTSKRVWFWVGVWAYAFALVFMLLITLGRWS